MENKCWCGSGKQGEHTGGVIGHYARIQDAGPGQAYFDAKARHRGHESRFGTQRRGEHEVVVVDHDENRSVKFFDAKDLGKALALARRLNEDENERAKQELRAMVDGELRRIDK
jgi:hypothetical protein